MTRYFWRILHMRLNTLRIPRIGSNTLRISGDEFYYCTQPYTVKKAVKLLDAPSKNTILMLNKFYSTVEILCLSSHVFFFYPASEQESST
jgi:protein tyrosine/serine phosphatase